MHVLSIFNSFLLPPILIMVSASSPVSFSVKIIGFSNSLSIPSSRHLGSKQFPCTSISGVTRHVHCQKLENPYLVQRHARWLCSIKGENNAYGFSEHDSTSNDEGSSEKTEASQALRTSSEILKKLKRYGISGILSYGLSNTAYYLTIFLVVWLYVAPTPGKLSYFAAVERFLKAIAMVWAGSQVTKLLRAAGALALAPFVDRGLSWFTVKFKFESGGKAFAAIAGFCFGLALILFLVVTLLWA